LPFITLAATTENAGPSPSVTHVLRKIYFLLILLIAISTTGGVIYAVVQDDVGTGLSIATYVLTCLSLILALLAIGEWLGLTKPDSFAFAYDLETNQVIGSTYLDRAFQRRSAFSSQGRW